MEIKAYAKVNLTLEIMDKDNDTGYHKLKSIMYAIGLCDLINIELSARNSFSCSPNVTDRVSQNIAYKAMKQFFKATKIKQKVKIAIKKNIPQKAGLGGGSSDAAAVLVGLDSLFGTNIPLETLFEMGKNLGADVPFCIYSAKNGVGSCALCEGYGEIITPVKCTEQLNINVLKEDGDGHSTAEMYKKLDEEREKPSYKPQKHRHDLMIAVLGDDSICDKPNRVARLISNDFNIFADKTVIEKMKKNHAAAMLSGSGDAVFGIVGCTNKKA